MLARDGASAMTEKERSVPCGSCQACCQREWIILDPAAGDVIELYETEDAIDPKSALPAKALAHKPNGDCFYLAPGGCSIHGHRPHMCRIFDCRVHYLNTVKMPASERQRQLRAHPNVKRIHEIGRAMLKKHPLIEG